MILFNATSEKRLHINLQTPLPSSCSDATSNLHLPRCIFFQYPSYLIMVFNLLIPLLINANTSKLATQSKMSKFLWDRQVQLTHLCEKGEIDGVLELYHEDVRFLDHLYQGRTLDKADFEKHLRSTYETPSDVKLETHSVYAIPRLAHFLFLQSSSRYFDLNHGSD